MITRGPLEGGPLTGGPSFLQKRIALAVLLVALGLAWGLLVNVPQQAILTRYPADWQMALYFAVEHLPTEAFLVSAILLLRGAARAAQVPLVFGLRGRGAVPWLAWPVALACIPVILLANIGWQLLLLRFAVQVGPMDDAFAQWWVHDPATFWTLTLIYVAIAPPIEEVLFRGIFFQWLARRCPLWLAVLVTALIFAAVHADVIGFGGMFALGVCSAVLLRAGRSLWPCILLHLSMNALSVAQSMGMVLR